MATFFNPVIGKANYYASSVLQVGVLEKFYQGFSFLNRWPRSLSLPVIHLNRTAWWCILISHGTPWNISLQFSIMFFAFKLPRTPRISPSVIFSISTFVWNFRQVNGGFQFQGMLFNLFQELSGFLFISDVLDSFRNDMRSSLGFWNVAPLDVLLEWPCVFFYFAMVSFHKRFALIFTNVFQPGRSGGSFVVVWLEVPHLK